MSDPATHGAFTDYVARLVQAGAVQYDDDDKPESVTDVYAVTLPRGVRPVLSDISGIPEAGAQHGTYPYLVRGGVAIRNAVEMAGSLAWYIDVAFGVASASTSVTNPDPDPEQPGTASVVRIVERAWPTYETQVDIVADALNGSPVLNAAGDLYDRVPTITRRYIGARVKRLEQNFPSLALSLDGTLNQTEITVLGVKFPIRTARLEIEIEDSLAVGSETRYAVTYNLVPSHNTYGANLDAGWDLPLLEAGFAYKGADGELVRFVQPDENGNPTPTALPQKLAGDGTPLADGADPVITVWHTYRDADWTNLKLPSTPTEYDPPAPTPPDPDPPTP